MRVPLSTRMSLGGGELFSRRQGNLTDPVLVVIDDDPSDVATFERLLRIRYGADYRVLAERTPEAGLDLLDRLARQGEAVALVAVALRLPGMDGFEFLTRARAWACFPGPSCASFRSYWDDGRWAAQARGCQGALPGPCCVQDAFYRTCQARRRGASASGRSGSLDVARWPRSRSGCPWIGADSVGRSSAPGYNAGMIVAT